jgi:hypothetical protein
MGEYRFGRGKELLVSEQWILTQWSHGDSSTSCEKKPNLELWYTVACTLELWRLALNHGTLTLEPRKLIL